jgi:hypothetical protein
VKHHGATAMGVVLIPARPLEHAVLKIVYRAPVIQTVKQSIQLFEKGTQRCDSHAVMDTCIADSSMIIKHIHQPSAALDKNYLKLED